MKTPFLVLSFHFCALWAVGQHPEISFEKLSVQQGLADHSTNCVTQDRKGFMWIGGINGLYKYDGYKFTYFKNQPGCKDCPSFKNVFSILEVESGLLWILSDAGITIFDPESEKSVLVYSFLRDSPHGRYNVKFDMIKDSEGNIWASGLTGLIKISLKSSLKKAPGIEMLSNSNVDETFNIESIQLSDQNFGPDNSVSSFLEDIHGNIWIGCAEGLYIKCKGDQSFLRLDKGANHGTFQTVNYLSSIIQINDNSFLLASYDGLYFLTNVKIAFSNTSPDISKLKFTLNQIKGGQRAISLAMDRNKNYILGTDKELYLIKGDFETGKLNFESLYQSLTDPQDAGYDKELRDIFEDRSGMIWVAHDYFGLSRFNLIQSQFVYYKNLVTNYFTSTDINPIYIDHEGNLWVGTFGGGLYKIPKERNVAFRYDLGIPRNNIVAMQLSSPGVFWIGMFPGLLEFDSKTGKFRDPLPDTKIANNLRGTSVWDMLKDGDNMYIATISGLFAYSIKHKIIKQFSFNKNDTSLDDFNTVISLIKMRNGEIWAGTTFNGINRINFSPQNDSLSLTPVITNTEMVNNGISISERKRIYEDSKGFLWLTNFSGLHNIDLKTHKVKHFRLFKNIDFPEVWSIVEDDHYNLWLGTHVGLCRFDVTTGKTKVFEQDNGLPILVHGQNSVFKDERGRLYFGGIGGFYSFHPDSLRTNDSVPSIVITEFRLSNKLVPLNSSKDAILAKNISYSHFIELQHDQNDISFEFAALDYNQPLKNKYAYRLEGYQDEWVESDAKNRIASYTNLDPGTYTFRVIGSNNDEVWNQEGTNLVVLIHRPWWGTTLAWILYVVLFIGLIGSYIRWRLQEFNKEKIYLEKLVHERTQQIEEQKEEILLQKEKIVGQIHILEDQNQKIIELDELKTRFFTNISHEFRNPLSMIQNPVEELLEDPRQSEKQKKKLNLVRRNSQRMLHLVNQLLDISKMDSSNMKLELAEGDATNYLRLVATGFSSLAETKSIRYEMRFPEKIYICWFDGDKLEKIAANLLSNAFKFTPEGGEIFITAQYIFNKETITTPVLTFSITDSGIGIPAERIEKIFDRFYQVESSVKQEGGGTGIGLSIARDMARLMHGDVTVSSELCKGSTFAVRIPLGLLHLKESEFVLLKSIPESIVHTPILAENYLDSYNGESKKESNDNLPVLLIVEDSRDIRLQLSESFSQDYTILEAIDGVAGFKKATEKIPDLVITDLMMPRMDGKELCFKLKNDENTCHIPVIMLTAKNTSKDKITGFESGADDYIPKPFQMAELKARVVNLLEQRKKLRERFSREVTLQPSELSITPLDEKFLNKAISIVEKHIDEEGFDLTEFRKEMNMSRSTLFRKLHALTGQSPTEFIRTIRLKRAARLLKQHFGNITQVSLEVGFSNLSYFNRSFKKIFGISPVKYAKGN